MFRLDGHAALITGSTHGIGAAIACALAQAGANVVLHGLTESPAAHETVAQCRQYGVRADVLYGDLAESTDAAVDQLVRDALRLQPHLDLLVNNAGGYFDVPFLELDYATFDRTMRLNVYSYFFLTQRLARHWVAQSVAGRVVMIGSINGRLAEPVHAAYDTSKGAVEQMVRTLCVELAPHAIRVNGLAPGLIETPLTQHALADSQLRRWMELHTPNRSIPSPTAIGPAALFLLSDEAFHIHGQMLLVDGGMSCWQQPDPPTASRGD